MSGKLILTVIGATGAQGGSVIDTVLSRPDLAAKYALRGISRNPSSDKAKALSAKGVEVIKADLDDLESLEAAISGSSAVFGVTNFWETMSKVREIEQGKNIFAACQAANVKHLVWSSLPNVAKLSNGRRSLVDHFDSKAEVEEFIESNKGSMIASYFMPAIFVDNIKSRIGDHGQGLTLALPFPDPDIPIPYIDERRDVGKYVVGLLEAGAKANGARVQGVSFWTTPNKLVAEVGRHVGKEVRFVSVSGEVFASFLPEAIKDHITDMLLWVGEDSYFGLGSEKIQAESDEFLIAGADLQSCASYLMGSGTWER